MYFSCLCMPPYLKTCLVLLLFHIYHNILMLFILLSLISSSTSHSRANTCTSSASLFHVTLLLAHHGIYLSTVVIVVFFTIIFRVLSLIAPFPRRKLCLSPTLSNLFASQNESTHSPYVSAREYISFDVSAVYFFYGYFHIFRLFSSFMLLFLVNERNVKFLKI